ncbi:MAG: ATP-binding protein [Lachnospiraceae bacterium]|nr:ATP-binding protein [Lachnospiraceae bacterium]
MQNPFSLSFGKTPQQYISRLSQTDRILESFNADNSPAQVFMLTGIRGSGKTVMMTNIANQLRENNEWIVIELNPERDMLNALAAAIYALPEFHKLFIKAKLDFSALGLGVSVESATPVTDVEVALDRMFEEISRVKRKVLITVDEVINNPNVRIFAASFQIFIRKDYPVYLLMTGLYENIYNLQNEKSLTFLYRAPKIFLEPLNYTAMASQYKSIFSLSDEQAQKMAAATKGYSYAFQVLGYLFWEHSAAQIEDILPDYDQYLEEYVYEKIWSELSDNDKKVLIEMVKKRETKVTAIREGISMSTSEFSVYRDRLKRKGIIEANQYGHIRLLLPRFEEFISRKEAYD